MIIMCVKVLLDSLRCFGTVGVSQAPHVLILSFCFSSCGCSTK